MAKSKADIRHVSVYGQKNGQARRWELSGSPKQLRKALKIAVKYAPEKRFPRFNPFPNVVLGDWNNDIVKVDWDERSIVDVKRFSFMLNNRYKLDGFIIFRSSVKTHKVYDEDHTKVVYTFHVGSYHTVFNRKVSYGELLSILGWLCLYVKDENLTKWFSMQLIKGTFTLRHGFKRKSVPKIVFRFGNQDRQITEFLANREFILKFLRESASKLKKLKNMQRIGKLVFSNGNLTLYYDPEMNKIIAHGKYYPFTTAVSLTSEVWDENLRVLAKAMELLES